MPAVTVEDFRKIAQRRLPPFLFEYIDGGSYTETTLRRNVEDLQTLALRQQVLKDVSNIDTGTNLFGSRLSFPLVLAPIGLAGMYARRGETQAVRAANRANIPFCLSTVSACSLEEVGSAATNPFWFQLYMMRDRTFVRDLIAKAKKTQCSALVFTVDMPVAGVRYRDFKSGLAGVSGTRAALRRIWQALGHPAWAWDVGLMGGPHSLGNVAPILGKGAQLGDLIEWINNNFDPTATWTDLEFIRSQWPGPLIIKGILDPADATKAADSGADAIVVSNHGGRQLDGAPSTARTLAAISDAVGSRIKVFADGGVRSGLDVFRMLALGADAVLIGRAWAYGLAAAGEKGVAYIIAQMQSELSVAMSLTGTTTIGQISQQHLIPQTEGNTEGTRHPSLPAGPG